MSEVWFYHLERQRIEAVLPGLVEKSRARGWRVVIETPQAELMQSLDTLLWTFRDDSFLPHGTSADAHPENQPVYLTTGPETPNGAQVRFLVAGADPTACLAPASAGAPEPHLRVVILFDGRDDSSVATAREQWRALKASSHVLSYWQQTQDGGWQKKA
ncbi:MAG: DNA polymerase III subunit chi [Hyphomicrobiales bacterium]|nr:DNA polymerase III subunit chi [Hyphomicrobiales bacterium]